MASNRFLHAVLATGVGETAIVASGWLHLLRQSVYPHNRGSPPAPPPQGSIGDAAASVSILFPAVPQQELEQMLAVVGSGYCNRALVYSLLDRVVARLVPELTVQGLR